MNIFIAGSLIRALAYLWVSFTAYSIAQLYCDGYEFAGKDSAIIMAIIKILNQISIIFFVLSIVAASYVLSREVHKWLVLFLPLVVIQLGILLTKFRKESVRKQ